MVKAIFNIEAKIIRIHFVDMNVQQNFVQQKLKIHTLYSTHLNNTSRQQKKCSHSKGIQQICKVHTISLYHLPGIIFSKYPLWYIEGKSDIINDSTVLTVTTTPQAVVGAHCYWTITNRS
jgi:hypothetical protein